MVSVNDQCFIDKDCMKEFKFLSPKKDFNNFPLRRRERKAGNLNL